MTPEFVDVISDIHCASIHIAVVASPLLRNDTKDIKASACRRYNAGRLSRLQLHFGCTMQPNATPLRCNNFLFVRQPSWVLGAPHNGLAMLIWRIGRRISDSTVGRAAAVPGFPAPIRSETGTMQSMTVSGLTIGGDRPVSTALKNANHEISCTPHRRDILRRHR